MISANDRPPASLVILGYNQERFIADAVRAAFAQDYANLDIVFSDDGSGDRTFAIMSELAAKYAGPHRVRVNRTKTNQGTLAHVYEAAALSAGELIVLGAGDDIPYPHRVSRLVERWRETGADGLSSGYDRMDDGGRVFEAYTHAQPILFMPDYFPQCRVPLIRGACSAYSRVVFDHIALPPERILFEDTFFTLMLALKSRPVAYVDDALIGYRQHDGSITHGDYAKTDLADVREREQRSAVASGWYVDVLSVFERTARTGNGIDAGWGTPAKVDFARVTNDLAFNRYRRDWLDGSAGDMLAAMMHVRDRNHLLWLMPRVLGPVGLAWGKQARAWLRKLIHHRVEVNHARLD